MNRGGLSTFYADEIGRVDGKCGTHAVYAVREVTMTEDLMNIEKRRLRNITLRMSWDREYELSREDANRLRSLLDRALLATAGDLEAGDDD